MVASRELSVSLMLQFMRAFSEEQSDRQAREVGVGTFIGDVATIRRLRPAQDDHNCYYEYLSIRKK
jgi:hypothetical protein